MWTRRAELYVYTPIDLASHFRRNVPAPPAVAELTSWATQAVQYLDYVLSRSEFIALGRFTLADIFAFGALDYGLGQAGFELPGELPHIRRWLDACASRPSARA